MHTTRRVGPEQTSSACWLLNVVWEANVDCKWTLVYPENSRDEMVTWEYLTPACGQGIWHWWPTNCDKPGSAGWWEEEWVVFASTGKSHQLPFHYTTLNLIPSPTSTLEKKSMVVVQLGVKIASNINQCNGWYDTSMTCDLMQLCDYLILLGHFVHDILAREEEKLDSKGDLHIPFLVGNRMLEMCSL